MSADRRLSGRVAAVTGAASGIGLAIARRFAAEGARVAILEIDEEAGSRAADEIRGEGLEAVSFPCDVSDPESVSRVFNALDGEYGKIDILVNNAGIAHVGDIINTTVEDLDRLYAVNVKGVYLCSHEAVRRMLDNGGGVLLNLASIASHIGLEDRFAYSMSKGAVWTMTRSIATDYMKKGIRCNCVAPCRVHTPFVDGFIAKNYPGQEKEMFEKLSAYQPMGRMARPEEVADLALFLCSDDSAFITGHSFPIDGGVMVV